jgi:EAL domain-containing protein (putative c-di-GMP-specific phosphodiesterase class I)
MEQLALFARPCVALLGRHPLCGYEILLTLRHLDTSLDALADYLSALSLDGAAAWVDRWVLTSVLGAAANHRAGIVRSAVSLSVPLSVSSLCNRLFRDHLCGELRNCGLPAGTLTIRIPEHQALEHMSALAPALGHLRDAGCGIAIDGMGSRDSSYRCVQRLPLTWVQFDGELVRAAVNERQAEADLRFLLQVVRGMPVNTCADFVDNAALARKVRSLGVDFAHGSVFGRPRPLWQALDGLVHARRRPLTVVGRQSVPNQLFQ